MSRCLLLASALTLELTQTGCTTATNVRPASDALQDASPSDELWAQCQYVVSSLEPASRTGRTAPVILAHLALVDVADACRSELGERVDADHVDEQLAFLELTLLASTHQAVLAYAEEGLDAEACRWLSEGSARAARWYSAWGNYPGTGVADADARWVALKGAAARERLFFDLHLSEHCGP